jgi:hypothetical protein
MPPKHIYVGFREHLKKAANRALKTLKTLRRKETAALYLFLKLKEMRLQKKRDFVVKKRRLTARYPEESLDGDEVSEDSMPDEVDSEEFDEFSSFRGMLHYDL